MKISPVDKPSPNRKVSMDNKMTKTPPATPFKSSTCQFLLRMAQSHVAKNELRLATDIFIRVIEDYPNSKERKVAQDGVLGIAQHYETEGKMRVALDLLEKIDQAVSKA